MAWRPHGKARVSARNPQAWAVCDRCYDLRNLVDLQWQFEWAGNKLVNQRILVCDRCLDIPQQQLMSRVLSADPIPVKNPRPCNWSANEEGGYVTTPYALTELDANEMNEAIAIEDDPIQQPS